MIRQSYKLICRRNLLDALFNPNNEMKASQDGFYIYDSAGSEEARFRKHADVITHWQPLPEPPYMIAEEPFMKVKERIKNELALHKQFIVDLIKVMTIYMVMASITLVRGEIVITYVSKGMPRAIS